MTLTGFSPSAQSVGKKVILTGTGFTQVTSVKFNGIDVLLFTIVNDITIWAYPDFNSTGTITISDGVISKTIDGFTELLTRVKLTQLPVLGRDATVDDKVYVWDNDRNILTQSPISALPGGTFSGGGTGGGGTGNVQVFLGSPFKVYNNSGNYEYDAANNQVIISDIRLLGKTGYVVSSTDLNLEFDDYDETNDTGNLVYDPSEGILIIKNYELPDKKHLTITVDGIISQQLQNLLTSLDTKTGAYDELLAPFKVAGGVCLAWRKTTAIPTGWQEATDLRGKILIGKDPADVYNPTTNPNGLSQPVGTPVGNKTVVLIKENLPNINITPPSGLGIRFLHGTTQNGGNPTSGLSDVDGSRGLFSIPLGGSNKPVEITPKGKIIIWIEYIGA